MYFYRKYSENKLLTHFLLGVLICVSGCSSSPLSNAATSKSPGNSATHNAGVLSNLVIPYSYIMTISVAQSSVGIGSGNLDEVLYVHSSNDIKLTSSLFKFPVYFINGYSYSNNGFGYAKSSHSPPELLNSFENTIERDSENQIAYETIKSGSCVTTTGLSGVKYLVFPKVTNMQLYIGNIACVNKNNVLIDLIEGAQINPNQVSNNFSGATHVTINQIGNVPYFPAPTNN